MAIKGAFVKFVRKTRGRESREVEFLAFGTVLSRDVKGEDGQPDTKELELIQEGQISTVQEAINMATSDNCGMSEQDLCDAIVHGINDHNYSKAVGVDELDELLSTVFDMNDETQKTQASTLKRGANASAKSLVTQGIETTPLVELASMIERIIAQRAKIAATAQ